MKTSWYFASAMLILLGSLPALASDPGSVLVLQEPGLLAADAAPADFDRLRSALPAAKFVSANELQREIASPGVSLVVLPYGSAFPEQLWPEVYAYLSRGGNLLVIGGRPFTRAAFRAGSTWQLRNYSVRFIRELQIDQYQETPGSKGLNFEANPELPLQLVAFHCTRAFSPIIRLSSVDVYKREGSAGSLDARLDTLAWGTAGGRRLSAPAIVIDHVRNRFAGGRWVFVNAEIGSEFYRGPAIAELATLAARGSEELTARPSLPLYASGEPVEVELNWGAARKLQASLRAEVSIWPEGDPKEKVTRTVAIVEEAAVTFPPVASKGLHVIEARLFDGDRFIATYHSGFWMRDADYLRSGPILGLNRDYFELNGKPLAVVGTTYMASDVQRLFFDYPNVYVWNRDMAQIHGAGLNMLRTGWWSGWEHLCDQNGQPSERTLRTIEAYLMTARKHGVPVQFNFFAFLPQVLGGTNAYLDPEAIRRQNTLYAAVASRFRDVPFVAWDLINEPSFSQHLWKMRPNGDAIELARWNEWLKQQYPDRAALAHAWNLAFVSDNEVLPVPTEAEFLPRSMYVGANSLKLYDFYLFAQEEFASWAKQMRDGIRATGAQQFITVGQDEGGYDDRLSPAFFGPAVDFTTNHTWWDNDSLLWDALVAKQGGKPLLIQETGLQRELTMDEIARRSPEDEAALLERKLALSLASGTGAIQWLWNANAYMTAGNEAPIGALRADSTEKPEAKVLRDFAAFAEKLSPVLRNPEAAPVAIITSQAAQFSVLRPLQIEAQRKAVRALAYHNRIPAYVVAENQFANLGTPKLAILPSPQALSETAWSTLLKYVKSGGNLLVTGSVDRDEHWQRTHRTADLKLNGSVEPLTHNSASMSFGDAATHMTFSQEKQSWLEDVRFADRKTTAVTPYGRGKVFWASYPVELADGVEPAAQLYTHVLKEIGITPRFALHGDLSPGVLVYPLVLQDAVMYLFVSDDADDATIDLLDLPTGAKLRFQLPSGRATLKVVRKSDGAIIADYAPKGLQ